jgi:hypothetical protein
MTLRALLALVCVCPVAYCQHTQKPITHVEACKRFSSAVVQVDTDVSHGTGFIVDPDGWILTAFHVVVDMQRLIKYGSITVTLNNDTEKIPAEIVSPIDDLARARDFAVLKITKAKLPYLEMGNEDDVAIGSAISVIGLPLAAMFPPSVPLTRIPQFCLAGTVAAQTSFPLPNRNHLDTIYFQGVSIKGISGAPIISLDTGKVIGIADTRMTGINRGLDEARTGLTEGTAGGNGFIKMGDVNVGKTIASLIDILDTQLANGLGTGTGAADAEYAVKKAQRDYAKHHPNK